MICRLHGGAVISRNETVIVKVVFIEKRRHWRALVREIAHRALWLGQVKPIHREVGCSGCEDHRRGKSSSGNLFGRFLAGDSRIGIFRAGFVEPAKKKLLDRIDCVFGVVTFSSQGQFGAECGTKGE